MLSQPAQATPDQGGALRGPVRRRAGAGVMRMVSRRFAAEARPTHSRRPLSSAEMPLKVSQGTGQFQTAGAMSDASLSARRVQRPSLSTEAPNRLGRPEVAALFVAMFHVKHSEWTGPNHHGIYIRAGDSICKMRDGELSPDGDPGSETRASSLDAFVIFKFRHRHGSRGAWRKIRGGYVRVNFRSQFSCAAIRSVAFDGSGHSGFSKARPDAPIREPHVQHESADRCRESIRATGRASTRLVAMFHVKHPEDAVSEPAWPRNPCLGLQFLDWRRESFPASRIRNPKPLSFPKDGFDIFPVSESTRINRMRVSRFATGTRRESPAHDPLPGDSPEGRRSFPMPLA